MPSFDAKYVVKHTLGNLISEHLTPMPMNY